MERKNVLVVALQGLGNLVMALPAVAKLGVAVPAPRIDVLVPNKNFGCILEGNTYVNNVLVSAEFSLVGLIRQLRAKSYDAVVLSYPSGPRSTLLALACGAGKQIAVVGGRNRLNSFLLTHQVRLAAGTHDVDANLQVAATVGQALGIRGFGPTPAAKIYISDEENRWASEWQERHIPVSGGPIVAIAPGSGESQAFKRWPVSFFGEVATSLGRDNAQASFVWCVGPDERDLAVEIRTLGLPENNVVVEDTSLRETLAILNQCSVLISNDNGLMHMAGALELHVVAVFGPTDENRNGPNADLGTVVTSPMSCRPCYSFDQLEFRCTREIKCECLGQELVGPVVQKVRTLLSVLDKA